MKRWFRRRPSDLELREELESHLAMRAEHDGGDASAARRRFGNVLQTHEAMRRVWIAAFWETLAQDAASTWRSWRRHPAFALTAILVLSLGLGVSTALFSALDRILFRSLPYPHADRLVSVGVPGPGSIGASISEAAYLDLWRPAPPPFESATTLLNSGKACDVTEEPPERLSCALVEANLLSVLDRAVAAGRDFSAEDDRPGAPVVALIRHSLSIRRFGADLNAIGQTLNLDGHPVLIVGVLSPHFEMPEGNADVLLPARLRAPDTGRLLMLIARLKPGVTFTQAESAIQPAMSAWYVTRHFAPAFAKTGELQVRSLLDRQLGDAPRAAWFLLGAVGTFLLIACVNVTNLMLARHTARQREFAVRASLGAGKGRLARLAITESVLLAAAAGGLGLIVASTLLKVFVAMAPASIPRIAQASLDPRVLVVASALAVMSGLLIGVWPAMAVLRTDVLHGSRATVAVRPRLRFMLVTAQIALTVAMLGGASLLLRSLWNLVGVPLGFASAHVTTLSATLSDARYHTPEQQLAFQEDLLNRVSHMPGAVAAAATSASPPIGISMIMGAIDVENQPSNSGRLGKATRLRLVTPQYFETFQIPLTSGRAFSEADRRSSESPAILTESAAQVIFPGERAIGQRIRPTEPNEPWHEVVGIVKDIHNSGVTQEPQPEIYFLRGRPSAAAARAERGAARFVNLAVRTTVSPDTAVTFLRQAAAELDPQLPVSIRTIEQQVNRLTERPRFIAFLIAAFAGFALVLAATGLYGVASFLVTGRTRDIGVRMALGATPRRIAARVLAEAGSWIAGGAVLGTLLAWTSRRVLAAQLFGITMNDSTSWLGTFAILSVVLVISVLRPAARAARVDPLIALREE